MTPQVITISYHDSIAGAFHLMKENNIRRLPVMDQNKLTGILTQSDLYQAAPSSATSLSIYELNYLLAKTKVRDIFPSEQKLVSISPDSYIETAAALMLEKRISGLPVLEEEQLVGIITETDLFRALVSILGVQRPHTRIDALIPDGPGGLADITGVMSARGINIINTAVYFSPSLNKYKVILRIEEQNYGPAVDDLISKGYEIESVIVSAQ
jgi:acetoin utilization protein AcuB